MVRLCWIHVWASPSRVGPLWILLSLFLDFIWPTSPAGQWLDFIEFMSGRPPVGLDPSGFYFIEFMSGRPPVGLDPWILLSFVLDFIWPTWSFGMELIPKGFNPKWPPPDHDTCLCLLADLPSLQTSFGFSLGWLFDCVPGLGCLEFILGIFKLFKLLLGKHFL